jgi:hypothetical protein
MTLCRYAEILPKIKSLTYVQIGLRNLNSSNTGYFICSKHVRKNNIEEWCLLGCYAV